MPSTSPADHQGRATLGDHLRSGGRALLLAALCLGAAAVVGVST